MTTMKYIYSERENRTKQSSKSDVIEHIDAVAVAFEPLI